MSTEITKQNKLPTIAELTSDLELAYKTCAWCENKLPLSEFYPRRERGLNEYRSHCKGCAKERQQQNREKQNEYTRKSYKKNAPKRKFATREYRKNNLETVMLTEKKSREKHKEKRLQYSVAYHRQRRQNDPLFKFRHDVSNSIYNSFVRGSHSKDKSCIQILGCEIDFFKEYIQSKFTNGMDFSNYGKWHLDHIIPLSTGKTHADIEALNHYTNFQPLWAIDNLKKSNKSTLNQLQIL